MALDRTRHALDTRLMATVAADSEPDVHFVLRYKVGDHTHQTWD